MWYVVAHRDEPDEGDLVWTVSQYPQECGWETDSGFPGYGLTKIAAQFLCDAANEKEARDGEFVDVVIPQSYI